jgi:DNA-binding MarR family transcriptional regulator
MDAPDLASQRFMSAARVVFGPLLRRRHPDESLELGQTGRAGMSVLEILYEAQPRQMSEIAGNLGVTRSTVTTIIDKLVEGGLVERETDAVDRRRSFVHLTEMGTIAASRAAEAQAKAWALFWEHIPDEMRLELLEPLETIAAYLSATPAP